MCQSQLFQTKHAYSEPTATATHIIWSNYNYFKQTIYSEPVAMISRETHIHWANGNYSNYSYSELIATISTEAHIVCASHSYFKQNMPILSQLQSQCTQSELITTISNKHIYSEPIAMISRETSILWAKITTPIEAISTERHKIWANHNYAN